MSVPKISALAGCGCWKVINRMKKFGIPRNPRGYNLSRYGVDNLMKRPGVVNPFQGKTHSAATRAVLSRKASVPKPYLRGDNNGMSGRSGPANPNWKGGYTPERQAFYASREWERVNRIVRYRDRYRCKRCNSPKSGRRSQHIHHVLSWSKYPSLRCEPRNLVLLCKDCHDWIHSSNNKDLEWRGIRAFNRAQALLANY